MGERIAVLQLAKLGDFIQSTPVLASIRRKWPEAKIVLAAEQAAVVEAARLSPLVDEVFVVREGAGPPKGFFQSVFVLNSHLRAAALARQMDYQTHYGPELAGDKLEFTPAQKFLMNVLRFGRSLGRFNLVDVWNSLLPEARPGSLVWPSVEAGAQPLSGPEFQVGFQLGSRNHLRRWPVEHFVSLTERLHKAGLPVRPVLLGSAGEKALGLKFEKLLGGGAIRPLNLIGSTGLESLGQVLGSLDLLVTPDTGSLHLAAALKKPVLGLFFGPAFGPETGPYGPGHLIYQASASCGPCRESAGCRLRRCRTMPDPEIAARLARALLVKDDYLSQKINLPPGHRLWRTRLDPFGQALEPLGRPVLDEREVMALLLTELGRSIIRPSYEANHEGFPVEAGSYEINSSRLVLAGFKDLLDKVFFQNKFTGPQLSYKLESLSSKFGLKLALT